MPWYNLSGNESEATVPELVGSVRDCETKCEERSWCAKFEYDVFTKVCHFMRSWPGHGMPMPGDQLISGPPTCPGHVAFNVTIENVDIDKLFAHPNLLHLFKDTLSTAVVRNPDDYDESRFDEELIHVSNGSMSGSLHQVYTVEHLEARQQRGPYNGSVVATIAVYAERGIAFATAKIVSPNRSTVAERVNHRLESLRNFFVPVVAPGSEMFVSAVSPIAAFGFKEKNKELATIGRSKLGSGSVLDALQNIWTKVGAGEAVVAVALLAIALAMFSAALLRRSEREHRRLESYSYEPLQNPQNHVI